MKTYILYYRIILALALVFFLFIAFRMWRGKAGRVFRAILDVEKARNYDEENNQQEGKVIQCSGAR